MIPFALQDVIHFHPVIRRAIFGSKEYRCVRFILAKSDRRNVHVHRHQIGALGQIIHDALSHCGRILYVLAAANEQHRHKQQAYKPFHNPIIAVRWVEPVCWDLQPFVPFFRNAHLLTLAGNFWPRTLDERRFPVQERFFQTEPDVRVLVHQQRPEGPSRGELITVHGLEGSSQSGYLRSLAQAALDAGYAVHRYNMRSCGGTDEVCGPLLYHSGQTGDLLAVVRQIAAEHPGLPVFLAGFSLGGNVVLKLAGELGESATSLIVGVAAVSAPIDLAACSRQINKRGNILYSRRFIACLKERIRLKERLHPGRFPLDRLDRVRTVWDFDDWFTAPAFGFGTAENYYATQSSNQFLDRIRVPALLVQAKDDPMIPFDVFEHPALKRNSYLRLIAVEHGGHLGFVSRRRPRFWLDSVLLDWFQEVGNKVPVGSVLLD